MSIVFASITPHPPIIIPEIGGDEIKKVKKTIEAMKNLSQKLNEAEPETIIVISPHGLVYPDRMNVCGMPILSGNLFQFGALETKMNFKNDLDIAEKIDTAANQEGIETLLYNNDANDGCYELDHGTLVPLYFLAKNLDNPFRLIPVAYSFQDRLQHFAFGQVIGEIAKKTKKQIALIASGDLSHRLVTQAPAGYSDIGQEFDERLIDLIKEGDVQGILEMDEDFIEEAGECGYRSILILLGAIEKLKYKPKILSYEGPFGVGYLVANFAIR